MTSPVAHGYPDFGRYVASADKILASIDNGLANPFPIHGRYFVGDVPRIGITATLSIDNALFSVEFWSAESGGVQMGGQAFSVRQGGKLDTTIPVVGPWVDITVSPNGANPTYDLILSTNHNAAHNSVTADVGNVLCTFSGAIAAGATQTVTATRVWPGEAHWFWQTDSPLWSARINYLRYNGAGSRIDGHTGQAPGSVGRQIFLPNTPCQLEVVNQDVAIRTFVGALVARPIEPGR